MPPQPSPPPLLSYRNTYICTRPWLLRLTAGRKVIDIKRCWLSSPQLLVHLVQTCRKIQANREHCCWQKHAATLTTPIHEMLWFASDTAGRPSGEGSRKTQAKAIESARVTERMHNRTCRAAQNVKTRRRSVNDVQCLPL